MFPDRLKKLRHSKQMTQQELADQLNISKQTIGSWERGRTEPPLDTLKKIANFFNVSIDYLINYDKKYWELTAEEEKDIAKQIENIINQTENEADINFYGEPITEEDRELLANALEIGLRLSTETAKKNALKKKKSNEKED
ncbi:helix-turn-helix domain-containing protein [Tetragenococcus halophilus]